MSNTVNIPPAINLNKKYSIAEVSRITGKHRNTISNHINAGYIKARESRRNIRPAADGTPRKAVVILGRDLQTYLNTY
jgi:hypothetical protein